MYYHTVPAAISPNGSVGLLPAEDSKASNFDMF